MKRRLARIIALQSLYQMEMNEVEPLAAIQIAMEEAVQDNEAELEISRDHFSSEYVEQLVFGVQRNHAWIDETVAQHLKGWKVDRLSRVDRQILRIAAYELVNCTDIPTKVVINEAIELSKHFGTEESGKFVNGVLGNMLKDLDKIKEKVQIKEV